MSPRAKVGEGGEKRYMSLGRDCATIFFSKFLYIAKTKADGRKDSG
jgi:hypothetical protein